MYAQVGDFCGSRGPPTVPITQISRNAVFLKSQNPCNGGTLCTLRPAGIFVKYFLSFPQKNLSPEKIETNKVFTFYFLNDKILTYVNFASFFLGTIMHLTWRIGVLPFTPPVLTCRDHQFKMLAFFRGGEGSKICQIWRQIVVKNCQQEGSRGQKSP